MLKTIIALVISFSFTLTAGAIGTPAKGDPKKNAHALVKRMVANLSPKDFTAITGKKLNFFTRMAYKKMRRQFRRELTAAGLQNEYDTLYLADGTVATGIILSNTSAGIKYKTSTDEDSELKEIAAARIDHIAMAKSVRAAQEDEDAPIEKSATTAMWLGIGSFVLLFIPYLNVLSIFGAIAALTLGIVSLNKIKKSKGKLRGEGRAIAGIVLGSAFLFLLLIAVAALASTSWAWGW
jgi:Domain of unknown function (DUF4190)